MGSAYDLGARLLAPVCVGREGFFPLHIVQGTHALGLESLAAMAPRYHASDDLFLRPI